MLQRILMVTVWMIAGLSLLSNQAHAWGDLGHEVTAEIAEQIIRGNPQVMGAIREIIGVEPLAVSATWPDQVRADERFVPFAPFHFVTIFRNPPVAPEQNALTVLKKFPALLADKRSADAAKMIALRYLIHVVGDVHQPLHVGNEFDRGANMCVVQWEAGGRGGIRTNLHTIWDTNLVNFALDNLTAGKVKSSRRLGYKEMAKLLMEKYKALVDSNPSPDFDVWIQESSELRKTATYPDQLPDDARPYCKENGSDVLDKDIPVLDKNFAEKASLIVEKRLVLGGVRLAGLLKQMFGQSPLKAKAPTESKILQMLRVPSDKGQP